MSIEKKAFSNVSKIYNNYSLADEITEYDANEQYLAIKIDTFEIEIYEIPLDLDEFKRTQKNYGKMHCMIKTEYPVSKFKLNPNYLYVLLVVTLNKGILLFNIPKNCQKKEIVNYQFNFKIDEFDIYSAVFNPFNSHIIACSCSDKIIRIWSVKIPLMKKIPCSNTPLHMKWRKYGNFLGFNDKINCLKIYNLVSGTFIFYLDFEESIYDFDFFSNDKILVINKDKNLIYEYHYNIYQQGDFYITKKNKCIKYLKVEFKYFFPLYDYFILYSNKKINLYIDFDKLNYIHECSLSFPKIIKTSNNKKIIKILNKSEKGYQLIMIHNKNEKEEEDDLYTNEAENLLNLVQVIDYIDSVPDNLNENYFKDCPKCFYNIIEILHYKFNIDASQIKKEKKYLVLSEVDQILESNRQMDLISLRKYVKNELDKIEKKKKDQEKNQVEPQEKKNKKEEEKLRIFKTIKEEYMFYLNLILKDETNPTLILKYLSFLKENENKLQKLNIEHEKFKDELSYYSVILEKNELKKLFGKTFQSEKEKTKILLKDYLDNIKNNTLENFKNEIGKHYKARIFNQPISFENKDLIYYSINDDLYYDILKDEKDINNLNAKLFFINEIINRNIIDNYDQLEILIPLTHLLLNPTDKEKSLFFLNMIESKTLSDKELEEKVKIYNYNLRIDNKGKKYLALEDNNYFSDPNDLCFENIPNKNYQRFEKYNYKYLIANPPIKLDINKIKNHLLFTLNSRVFREAYKYLTGNDNYEIVFSKSMISEFINKIMFLPVYLNAVSFHDSRSLTTVISTMKKEINTKFYECDEKILFILENGVIIELIYHEFGHAISAVISFSENELKLTETPRKKYLDFKEGGYYLEIALFGRVIKNFSLGEALYVLNKENYNKSLEDFRKGFMELSNKDLIIKGEFKDFNLKNENEMEQKKNSIIIKAKNGDDKKDDFNNIQISIPLRNDILRRHIKEEDLEPYF